MSIHDEPVRARRSVTWVTPVTSLVIGLGYLVAGIAGGHPGFGVFGFLLMIGLAAVLMLIRSRSETVRGLIDRRDERINAIDLRATMFSGVVLITAVIVAAMVQIGRGESGSLYIWLGALAGISYLIALIYQRIRR